MTQSNNPSPLPSMGDYFQQRCYEWALSTLPPSHVSSTTERTFRFLEEALELAQSCNISRDQALTLLNCVFSRPPGGPYQEVGGTLLTLSILCTTLSIPLQSAAEAELSRVSTPTAKARILNKYLGQPRDSPLPGPPASPVLTTNFKEDSTPLHCPHPRLNSDGLCYQCGQDCRGIY